MIQKVFLFFAYEKYLGFKRRLKNKVMSGVVKFKTNFVSHNEVVDERLEELKKWCDVFRKQGLAPVENGFSCGNLSFRTQKHKNEFIITASGISAQAPLTDNAFSKVVAVDLDKMLIKAQGPREPSSESMLHFAVYNARPDVQVVFHGHCQKILVAAGQMGLIETLEEVSYGSKELVEQVLKILGEENFVVIKNHGFLSLEKSMQEAGQTALKVLERCDKM